MGFKEIRVFLKAFDILGKIASQRICGRLFTHYPAQSL